jgi:hypothetical protein
VSPIRRDAEGRAIVDRGWEGVTERLIREAQERGEFEDLPHHGKPLPARRNPYAGEMALAYDLLQDAGMAPPWIEADKEARAWLDKRDALLRTAGSSSAAMRRTLERELATIVARHNAAVDRINAGAPTTRQHRTHLVLADELIALTQAIDDHRDGR